MNSSNQLVPVSLETAGDVKLRSFHIQLPHTAVSLLCMERALPVFAQFGTRKPQQSAELQALPGNVRHRMVFEKLSWKTATSNRCIASSNKKPLELN